jgi:16S rRNA processing protein RimM
MRTQVVVGVIGPARGLGGEVFVAPRTDSPELRFAAGVELRVEQTGAVLHPKRFQLVGGRLVVGFTEIADRAGAEAARGWTLLAEVDSEDRPEDPEEFYDWQLIGSRVLDHRGVDVGEVIEVVHNPAQDLLVVQTHTGESLIPFVAAVVPQVDLAGRELRLADLPGLLGEDE